MCNIIELNLTNKTEYRCIILSILLVCLKLDNRLTILNN